MKYKTINNQQQQATKRKKNSQKRNKNETKQKQNGKKEKIQKEIAKTQKKYRGECYLPPSPLRLKSGGVGSSKRVRQLYITVPQKHTHCVPVDLVK